MPADEQLETRGTLQARTPSQTVGPFFHYALPWKGGGDLTGASALGARPELFPSDHDLLRSGESHRPPIGEQIEIAGRITDGHRQPVADALIEIWQANATGRYSSPGDEQDKPLDPNFIGFGRSCSDETGEFRLRTIRPGRVPGPGNRLQAPHLAVSLLGRGLLRRLATRIYFDGEPANVDDPILELVPADRRATLIAKSEGVGRWRFDIALQGDDETVFFDL